MQCTAAHHNFAGTQPALAANAEQYVPQAHALPTFSATLVSYRKHLRSDTLHGVTEFLCNEGNHVLVGVIHQLLVFPIEEGDLENLEIQGI